MSRSTSHEAYVFDPVLATRALSLGPLAPLSNGVAAFEVSPVGSLIPSRGWHDGDGFDVADHLGGAVMGGPHRGFGLE